MFEAIKTLVFLSAVICAGYAIFYMCLTQRAQRDVGYRPALIFLFMAAVGFLSPNLWVVHAAFFCVVPLFAWRREDVPVVYLAALLGTPALKFAASIGGVELFAYTVQETIALGALATYFFRGGRGIRRPIVADLPFLAIFTLLFLISIRETSATHILRQILFHVLTLGIPYFVFVRTLTSVVALRRMLLWLGAVVAILAAVVLYEKLRFWPLYNVMVGRYGLLGDGMIVSLRLGWLRSVGPLGNATVMGSVLMMGAAAVIASRPAFASRVKYLAALGLILVSMTGPQSRGAWVGAGIALALITIYRGGKQIAALALPLGVAGGLAALALQWGSNEEELNVTVDYREALWIRGMEEVWKYPWFGDSFAGVLTRLSDLRQGEGIVDIVNSYLYFALTSGFVGAAVFVLAITMPALRLWTLRGRLRADRGAADVASFCFAVLGASFVMFAFTSFQERTALLELLFLGVAGTLSVFARNPARYLAAGDGKPTVQPARRPVIVGEQRPPVASLT